MKNDIFYCDEIDNKLFRINMEIIEARAENNEERINELLEIKKELINKKREIINKATMRTR